MNTYPVKAINSLTKEPLLDRDGKVIVNVYRTAKSLTPAPKNLNRTRENTRRQRQTVDRNISTLQTLRRKRISQ